MANARERDEDSRTATGLELRGLCKRYGDTPAVESLTLRVARHERVALLGPSGCGKSTVLRIIAGVERADAGQILVLDREVTRLPIRKRDIAMAFQPAVLYPHWTVYENLQFPLRIRPHPQQTSRLAAVIEALQLESLLKRRPDTLSGGEFQRAALARVLVRTPQLLLLDEPLTGLDAPLRDRLRGELVRLHQSQPVTTLYVTHDQSEALAVADRVAVLEAGRLHQVGTPHEIYRHPADTFVASFVGSPAINLWPAQMDSSGTVWLAGQRSLPDAPRLGRTSLPRPPDGGAVKLTLGVRPEDLRIAATSGGDHSSHLGPADLAGRISFTGTVHLALNVGPELLLEVRPDPPWAQLGAVRGRVAAGAWRVAQPVRLEVAVDQLICFGPDGQRLPPDGSV